MKSIRFWLCLLASVVLLSGCAIHPRRVERDRVFGDSYVIQTPPALMVVAGENGILEAPQFSTRPSEGFIWNSMGWCNLAVKFPVGMFEMVIRTIVGDCPADSGSTAVTTQPAADEIGRKICRFWTPVTTPLPIPSGMVSPRLRAPVPAADEAVKYVLFLTQTPNNGRASVKRKHDLALDYVQGDMLYKGKMADWGIDVTQCQAWR